MRPTAQQIAPKPMSSTEVKPSRGRAGSDFMVDVIKSLDIDYVYSNPASSFRGIHESLINYGKNTKPEFITCMHEESSVAMAHGYFKVTGKPQMILCHGTVGLQHATMAIYNAWCDRVPVIVVGGNDLDAATRPPGVPTYPLRRRTSTRSCATSPSGTTTRCRCSTSRSRSCAPTRWR